VWVRDSQRVQGVGRFWFGPACGRRRIGRIADSWGDLQAASLFLGIAPARRNSEAMRVSGSAVPCAPPFSSSDARDAREAREVRDAAGGCLVGQAVRGQEGAEACRRHARTPFVGEAAVSGFPRTSSAMDGDGRDAGVTWEMKERYSRMAHHEDI
jgi:hypothetical protein